MNIAWGSLGLVAVVAFAAAVAVVVLVSLALVGLSAREPAPDAVPDTGPDAGPGSTMSPAAGTTLAAICLLATVAIVLYGLYIIIA